MSTTALDKAKAETEKLRERMSRGRARAELEAAEIQNTAVELGTAYAFGSYKGREQRANRTLMTIGGLDPDVVWGGALYVAGRFAGGRAGEALQSGAKGILAGYAYQKGLNTR